MITIIGPRDTKVPGTVNTTSHSNADWSRGLSPFTLGPIALYGSHTARIFENAWQFAKLYPEHADANGQPTNQYWTWAQNGWSSTKPFRYIPSVNDGNHFARSGTDTASTTSQRENRYIFLFTKKLSNTLALTNC